MSIFETLNERVKNLFLKQPLEKLEKGIPYQKVIQNVTDSDPTPIQAFFNDLSGMTYTDYLQRSSEQAQKIDIYRQTAKIAECNAGITEIVDEIVYSRNFKDPIKIEFNLNNAKLEKTIEEAFQKIQNLLNIKKYLYFLVRQSFIDGQINVLLKYNDNPTNGIKEIFYLDPKFLYFDFENQVYRYVDFYSSSVLKSRFMSNQRFFTYFSNTPNKSFSNDTKELEYNIEEIVHQNFGLYSEKGIILSELEAAVKTANQLKTLEDLLIPLRFSRSISRRVFNIDVSELPNSKAEAYLKNVVNNFKYKKHYNTETGEVLNNQHITTMVEDYFIGNKAGSKGMQVDILDETGNLGELGDILYFYKLLYKSMGIPINRIYLEETSQQPLFDLQAEAITNEDIKFFMKITRLRQVYTEFLMEILKRELIVTKKCNEEQFENELKENINIYFSEENQFIERMNLTLFMKKIESFQAAKDLGGSILPVEMLYKEIFKYEDSEIKKLLKQIRKESKDPLYKKFYQDLGYDDEQDSYDEPNDKEDSKKDGEREEFQNG